MTDNLPTITRSAVTAAEFLPVLDIAQAIQRRNAIVEYVQQIMKDGTDYGKIPGVDKPTLLQPGAEKLITFFGLTPQMELVDKIEDWDGRDHKGEPFFYYRYRCIIRRGDHTLAVEEASANSREVKYRYRWAPADQLPPGVNVETLARRDSTVTEFEFAINKSETSGPYGKPAAYWQQFIDAIAAGTAIKASRATKAGKQLPAWSIPNIVYRIPNPEIADVVNTLQQMAEKRAKIRATRSCTGASEFFTQDVEDMEIIDVTPAKVETDKEKSSAPNPAAEPLAPRAPAPAGQAIPPDADDAQLQLIEAKTMALLITMFNGFPQDWKRPGSKLYDLFMKRRAELTPPAKGKKAQPFTAPEDDAELARAQAGV